VQHTYTKKGPNNVRSHTTELTTTVYFNYFNNYKFSKLK